MRRIALALCSALVVAGCAGQSGSQKPSDQPPSAYSSPSVSTGVPPKAPRGTADQQQTEFPITVSEDGPYLIDATGTPFLLHGDAAWSYTVQLSLNEAEDYLDARQAQGFNALIVNLIEHHFADNPPRNADGEEPFLTPGDFSTPNEVYFDHVDRLLELARQRGFVVLLAPAYLGYQGGDEGWFEYMIDNGAEALRDYGRYVGARYANFDNIIWLGGGDFNPPDEWLHLVNAVVDGIVEFDPDSLHAASWSPGVAGLDVPVEWIDINTVYTYEPSYLASAEQFADHDDTPQILLETEYEAERESTTPQTLRAQAYYAILTGSVGQVYGHGDIWQFTEDWREALRAPGVVGMVHFAELLSTLPWHELVPDLENELLIEGIGLFGTMDFAVAAATAERDLAVIYVPSVRNLRLDLSGFDGPIHAHFYDPTDGSRHVVDGSPLQPSSGVTLRTPAYNALGDSDWVIVLEQSSS